MSEAGSPASVASATMTARRAIVLVGAAAAAVAAARKVRPRRDAADPADPAVELRRKLAESRELAGEREEFEAAETPVDRAEPAVEDRRRDVHKQARSAVDEMQTPPNG
jgi:uncharacterized protein YlxW (UPF0749 family)